MSRRLRSLLCRVRGHQWTPWSVVIRDLLSRTPVALTCAACRPAVPTWQSPALISLSWGEVKRRPALDLTDYEASRPGTADTALPVPEATPEDSTPPPVLRSEWGTGEAEWWRLLISGGESASPSSTGAPAPTVESSTSTPTHSNSSHPSVVES